MNEDKFIKAFKQGQVNYINSIIAISEINKVLYRLRDQLNTISKNKLNITYSHNKLLINNEEICPFTVRAEGYPVEIYMGNHKTYCEDKEALEDTIIDMLKDVEINNKICKLMN